METIPARLGNATHLKKHQHVKVINTHGAQVVDTWFFNAHNLNEYQSNEHTRAQLVHMKFIPGQKLVTNQRNDIVELVEDTSPGVHDLLMAACDHYRYQKLGCKDYHNNCADNLVNAMKDLGYDVSDIPSPINLFMNIPWTDSGKLAWEAPVTKPGDYVVFRAEIDCVAAFSACPQDLLPINGVDHDPVEAHFEVY